MADKLKWKMIMFDLDGTLLPMDQDKFLSYYFGLLGKYAQPHGYEPEKLLKDLWTCTGDMVMNDGSRSNYDAFWQAFAKIYGPESLKDISLFDDFYTYEFQKSQVACGFNPKAKEAIEHIKQLGYRLVLATNPLFPHMATHARIGWAGLQVSDFEYITTYENSSHSKPNPNYYVEILDKVGLKANECLMVGNDVSDDMVASKIGMDVFLLTDNLINSRNKDISMYPQGNLDDLLAFIEG